MADYLIGLFAIFITVISYAIARYGYRKSGQHPLCLPILTSFFLIVFVLFLSRLSYEEYMLGAQWIHHMLGPAVVALAYPLYQHLDLLGRLALPILLGSLIGSLVGLFSGLILSEIVSLESVLLFSLLPKSVTTPVAMDISESLGGISSLAAVLVIIAGLTGALLGPLLFRIFRIRSEIGYGVGLGSASHAIGTATAFEQGELEGSISTVSMIVSALYLSVLTPIFVHYFT